MTANRKKMKRRPEHKDKRWGKEASYPGTRDLDA